MATAFLALNTMDGTTPVAQRYLNASPAVANGGGTFGALDSTTGGTTTHTNLRNRIVCFGGDEKTFLAVVGGTIYRTDDEFATWNPVQTLTSVATHHCVSGIHIVDLGGVPTAVVAYRTGTNTARAFRSSDGITWTDAGTSGTLIAAPNSTTGGIVDEIVYHNVLYLMISGVGSGSRTTIWFHDPGANSFGSFLINGSDINNSSGCFAVWQDMLVATRHSSLTSQQLVDITTGVPTSLVTLAGAGTVVANGMQNGMFVDPATGDLILFMYHTSPGGTVQCYQINKTTYAATLLTSTVLPTAVRALGNTFKARPYMDIEASLGDDPNNPPVYVYFAASGTLGTTLTMYKWNGVAALMTLVDSGGNVGHAISINPRPVGGQYSYTVGQLRLRIVGRTPVFGGVRYSFMCFSSDDNTAVKVRGFHDSGAIETLSEAATLTNPSVGTIVGAYNTGLIADGTTVYQVTWAAQDDGISQGERRKFGLDIVIDE
jgi:hypothetical protein